MPEINPQENRDPDVSSQETGCCEPAGEEDVETVDECEDHERDHGYPGSDWLEEGMVRNIFTGDGLDEVSFAEAEIYDAATYPGDKA